MRKLGLSAVRIGSMTLMLGGACSGPNIDFNSQRGEEGGAQATGGASLEGTGGAKAATGGRGSGTGGAKASSGGGESGTGGAMASTGGKGGAAAESTGGDAGTGGTDVGSGGVTGMGSGGGPGGRSPNGGEGGSDAAGSAAGGRGGATDATGGASIGDPSGGVDWEPWPTVQAVPEETCVVMQLNGGDGASTPKLVSKETWQYDSTTRILTRNRSTSGSPSTVSYVRFDAQGRREMVCHSESEFHCLEWTRDSFGNATGYAFYAVKDGPRDERALDPAHPPSRTNPSSGGAESEQHTLAYDASGQISSGTYYYPERGATLRFSRDSEGRCSDVEWGIPHSQLVEVDHWTHLGDKLVSRTVSLKNDPSSVRAVITYAYAADGTLAATAVDGRLDFPDSYLPTPPCDGVVDYLVRTSKQPDGSRWIELLYFGLHDERNNARVTRQGALTEVLRVRSYMSPACEALSLPKHTSQACEFERPLSSRAPLAWHNPLVTPIPIGSMTPMPD